MTTDQLNLAIAESEGMTTPLCTKCKVRPGYRSDGLCTTCHKMLLEEERRVREKMVLDPSKPSPIKGDVSTFSSPPIKPKKRNVLFAVGDKVGIKGHLFVIKSVKMHEIKLKHIGLLPKQIPPKLEGTHNAPKI